MKFACCVRDRLISPATPCGAIKCDGDCERQLWVGTLRYSYWPFDVDWCAACAPDVYVAHALLPLGDGS